MRLAWFSPMPPVRSGIATCSAEIVAALQGEHEIDVFVGDPGGRRLAGSSLLLRSAHDFVWRHQQAPYDLTVYQLGNSSHHDYLWPYLFRYPGLAVLHDAHLHHARAAALLRERRSGDYRAEFAANEPDISPDAAELAIAGFDSALLYQWPFTRLVVTASRMAAVHSRITRDRLIEEHPHAAIEHIHLGHGVPLSAPALAERSGAARTRLGIPAGAIVVGCFGGLTPDKRIPQILDAFQAVLPSAPDAWLLLAGARADHYDAAADVAARALHDQVVLTGYLDSDDELTDAIAASDITLNLRWPTAREMSGPWLRCLAAGRPSITIDLAQTADVATLDPRTWTANGSPSAAPVAVAIDILDEAHSLQLALRRLARDPALRSALGTAAREHWVREHSQDVMFDDYRRLIPLAAARPPPSVPLPAHLRDDESGLMTTALGELGVPVPWSKI